MKILVSKKPILDNKTIFEGAGVANLNREKIQNIKDIGQRHGSNQITTFK